MANNSLEISKNFDVVKHNDLIRYSRYQLTMVEQKILLRVIQAVKPKDTTFQTVYFSIKDFCAIADIDYNGRCLADIKRIIKNLADKSFWLIKGKSQRLCRWIQKATITEGSNVIEIKLDEDLIPFLIDIRKNFTQYSYSNVLPMRSKYSIRLFELLKSHEHQQRVVLSVDYLRSLLDAENYKIYKDFRTRVIDTAIKEINLISDIHVEYEPLKTGRKITAFAFTIVRQDRLQVSLSDIETVQ